MRCLGESSAIASASFCLTSRATNLPVPSALVMSSTSSMGTCRLRDGVHPGRERGVAAKRRDGFEGAHERALHELLGQRVVAHANRDDPSYRFAVLHEQRVEGGPIPASRALHERIVVG